MDETGKKALVALQNQCARREYCSSDIIRKLRDKYEICGDVAEEIISSLKQGKYLDDFRYAAAFARDKSHLSMWGPAKIRCQLRAKGIGDDIISDALAQIDESEAQAGMEKLLHSKWKMLKDDPQGKLKLIRFALGRGYDYGSVQNFLRNLTL